MTTTTQRNPISAQLAHDEPAHERIFNGDAPQFSRGPARRPALVVTDPLLQWATGLTTQDRRVYVGWLCEVGKDDTLDAAMEAAGFSVVTIKHGSGNLVTHWAIETANLFVTAEGVQSMAEMRATEERYGIAFAWRTLESGRRQSTLKLRGFLQELLTVGYAAPLTVSVKSTLTGDLLTALMRQYDVLDAIDTFRRQDDKPPLQPPFYACSFPLAPGQEVVRGSGGQTKEITPMVARIPDPITKEYVREHWLRREWIALVEAAVEATVAWSIAVSQQIAAGEEPQEQG